MSKITAYQRMIRTGQPYTRVVSTFVPRIEHSEDEEAPPTISFEDTNFVFGYTLEEKLVPTEDDANDPEWELTWEEHDLGAAADLKDAHALAADWRGSLVGQYPVR